MSLEEYREMAREEGRDEEREKIIAALMKNLKLPREKVLDMITGSQSGQVNRINL